ncbi:hypothetical protein [Herbaspirillum lusitanum]|uniref:hypothetical protein n=1 Tax=Herbaspirillum lusitanum TaxID=213312 RepID=UPI002238A07B|nr:hypothetical protein [Herbaspirillum lusitanum]
MEKWISPNNQYQAQWRGGGELGMSGPEWGWLTIENSLKVKGAFAEIIWSENSEFLAFVKWHIQDVPTRQGVEGYSFRIGVVRMSDLSLRYCGGNGYPPTLSLHSMTNRAVTVIVEGQQKIINLEKIEWDK